jgi:hypothetical protein
MAVDRVINAMPLENFLAGNVKPEGRLTATNAAQQEYITREGFEKEIVSQQICC